MASKDRIEALEAALRFYAEDAWEREETSTGRVPGEVMEGPMVPTNELLSDCGLIAQQALKSLTD